MTDGKIPPMFLTNDSASAPADVSPNHFGERLWEYVTIVANTPYFLVSYKIGDRLCCDILSSVWQLRQLTCETEVTFFDVCLLFGRCEPDKFNWKTGRLQSVLVGAEPGRDYEEALVFAFDKGPSLVLSALGSDESELLNVTKWFSIDRVPGP